MSPLRLLYLGLALWGAVHPLALRAISGEGGLPGPLGAFGAGMAGAAAWELVIAAAALTVWALAETRVRKNWSALLALPATAVLGIGCGLPLYLFLRTRPVT